MATTDLLLHLVSTMTKQEKRYFKLYSAFYSKENGNNTLRLFEFIEKKKVLTGGLTQAVQQEPYARQLPFLKSQLTDIILDSLAAYEASKSTFFQIQRYITHAEVLARRGLYAHAEKMLLRAERKALRTEEYPLLLDILYRRRSLLLKRITPTFEQDIDALYEQGTTMLDTLSSVSTYRRQMDRMQIIAMRYGSHPATDDREKMESIVAHLRAIKEEKSLPFSARLAIYNTLGTHAFLVHDSMQALEQYRNTVHLWREYPDMIQEQPERYCRYLLNFLSSLVSVGSLEEFTATARELRGYCDTSSGKLQESFLKDLWALELMFYLNRGLPDLCTDIVADIERHRKTGDIMSIGVASLITLYHNCSVYYFLQGKFAQCLDYINILQTECREELKRDVQSFSRIFSVVAHYELGNIDILDNSIRSAKRYLKKNEASGAFEKIVLAGIRSITAAVDATEEKKAFSNLHHSLIDLLHENEHEPLGITELLFWTQGHLEGRSIREVFIRKVKEAPQPDPRILFPRSATGRKK